MTAQTLTPRHSRKNEIAWVFDSFTAAALTAAADKHRWIVPFYLTIMEVYCSAGTAGSGGTSNIIDVHLNGTTIFTTQDNRPTLLTGDTGAFSLSGAGAVNMPPEVVSLKPGDILTYDVDQISTTGCALFAIAIVCSNVR